MIRVNNWEEVYEFIKNYKRKKINVILDTDTYNECDDQFALAYLLKIKINLILKRLQWHHIFIVIKKKK